MRSAISPRCQTMGTMKKKHHTLPLLEAFKNRRETMLKLESEKNPQTLKRNLYLSIDLLCPSLS